jgi:protein-tyrosine kinase
MDIKKSIEKAKKLRLEVKHVPSSQAPQQGAENGDMGWVSPDYCESRSIELNLKKLGKNRCVCILPDAQELGFYKVLRTQIQHRCKEKGWNTIMITSALPGEGKTLTSINLALTFAKQFIHTVLLVDCDFKRQNIHKYLGFSSDRGLIDNLVEDVPLNDLIIWPCVEKLCVISGGSPVHNSTELLSSPKMKTIITEMKKRYRDRYVIFDVPPVLVSADATAFAPLVDCIVMVVQAASTSIQDVRNALEMIPQEKFLGFVLNRQAGPMKDYYKYY